jgi:hypothetical protein
MELPLRTGSPRTREQLPAQKLGGRYKSNSRVQGGFGTGMFPFLTGAGTLEYRLDIED